MVVTTKHFTSCSRMCIGTARRFTKPITSCAAALPLCTHSPRAKVRGNHAPAAAAEPLTTLSANRGWCAALWWASQRA
jgi:hypothetical protein